MLLSVVFSKSRKNQYLEPLFIFSGRCLFFVRCSLYCSNEKHEIMKTGGNNLKYLSVLSKLLCVPGETSGHLGKSVYTFGLCSHIPRGNISSHYSITVP